MPRTAHVQEQALSSSSRTAAKVTPAPYRCEACNKPFSAKRALKRHLKENKRHRRDAAGSSVTGAANRCRQCSKTFVRAHDYRRHRDEQHGDGKVTCPGCEKVIRRNAPHLDLQSRRCTGRAEVDDEDSDTSSQSTEADEPGYAQYEQPNGTNAPNCKGKKALRPAHLTADYNTGTHEPTLNEGRILCGFCRRPFELWDNQALHEHLRLHFSQLVDGHLCSVCDIKFVHLKDLNDHFRCASRIGRCGFTFTHQIICTGHHDPVTRASGYEAALESDRFEFCYRLRLWEHAQLHAYLSSVSVLMERRRAEPEYRVPLDRGGLSIGNFQENVQSSTPTVQAFPPTAPHTSLARRKTVPTPSTSNFNQRAQAQSAPRLAITDPELPGKGVYDRRRNILVSASTLRRRQDSVPDVRIEDMVVNLGKFGLHNDSRIAQDDDTEELRRDRKAHARETTIETIKEVESRTSEDEDAAAESESSSREDSEEGFRRNVDIEIARLSDLAQVCRRRLYQEWAHLLRQQGRSIEQIRQLYNR